MSNNLNRPQLATGQTGKEQVVNDSTGAIDAAMTEQFTIAVSSGNAYTLSESNFRRNIALYLNGGTTGNTVTVTVPAIKRGLFLFINNIAYNSIVTIASQPLTAPTITASNVALLYCDGINVKMIALIGGGLIFATKTANYTIVLNDANSYIRMNVASANNLTIPPNSSVPLPLGSEIQVSQVGGGQTTIVAGAGVTINTPETLKLRKQYSAVSLVKVATNTWDLIGDLEAL